MAENLHPLEGQDDPATTNVRAHLRRDILWIWVVAITQLIFTVVVLSLAIALVSVQLQGAAFSRTVFTIFATVFSQIGWAYIFFFSYGTIDDDETRRLSWLFAGFLSLIFYFAAALAMTTLSLGSSCSDQDFLLKNPLFGGSESRCETAQTCVAFLWLGLAANIACAIMKWVDELKAPGDTSRDDQFPYIEPMTSL